MFPQINRSGPRATFFFCVSGRSSVRAAGIAPPLTDANRALDACIGLTGPVRLVPYGQARVG
ncbi:hypothetical protein ACWD4L_35555 [Streptomyces sp. NPDC002596]